MARREFSKAVKVAIVKAAMRDGVIYCQGCDGACKLGGFEIDHTLADQLGGKPTAENGRVLCIDCHKRKTAKDAGVIAKAKRQEAQHLLPKDTSRRKIACRQKPIPSTRSRDVSREKTDRGGRPERLKLPPRQLYRKAS